MCYLLYVNVTVFVTPCVCVRVRACMFRMAGRNVIKSCVCGCVLCVCVCVCACVCVCVRMNQSVYMHVM